MSPCEAKSKINPNQHTLPKKRYEVLLLLVSMPPAAVQTGQKSMYMHAGALLPHCKSTTASACRHLCTRLHEAWHGRTSQPSHHVLRCRPSVHPGLLKQQPNQAEGSPQSPRLQANL
mmetsp:Transcript_27833/g.61038  ORF Transcript_27833/g.61038 Transcript_27833/m.61038 type:complete len:117 (-) Transcript_27833:3203-3553(-)